MQRLTKAQIRLLQTTEEDATNRQVDRVADVLPPVDQEPTHDDIARNTLISDIFGNDILHDPRKVRAILKAQTELTEEMGHFRDAALNMGRIFLDVKLALSPREFSKAMRHAPQLFRGLSRGTVQKLMSVAEYWDMGRFPQEKAPKHYSILYEFTTLDDTGLKRAITDGVFNPEVTRAQVTRWKHQLEGVATVNTEDQPSPLENEFAGLQIRLRQILSDAVDIRKRMREIKIELAATDPGQRI